MEYKELISYLEAQAFRYREEAERFSADFKLPDYWFHRAVGKKEAYLEMIDFLNKHGAALQQDT